MLRNIATMRHFTTCVFLCLVAVCELRANSDSLSVARLTQQEFVKAGFPRTTITGVLPPLANNIEPIPTAFVGVAYGAMFYGLHELQANAWWKDERGPFHFQNDWDYALQSDKAGHFTAAYAMSTAFGEALLASGFSWEAATHYGGAMGLLYQTYVEVEDGYGTRWGFSVTDMAANTVGCAYYIAQYHVPFLYNFSPKWQYIPAEWIDQKPIPHPTAVVDDYNSSTFWLSVNVHNLLPEHLKKYWIRGIELSIGYGASNIGYPGEEYRRVVVGLDYNISELLPDGGSFWMWIKQNANLLKFPAPAIEFGKVTRFRLMYPFTIALGDVKL